MPLRRVPEVTGERLRGRQTVEFLEHAHAGACVGGYVNDPDLLSGSQSAPATVFSNLVRQADFPGRQKQQPPLRGAPGRAIARASRLARSVGEHVRRLASVLGRKLGQLIETEQGIRVAEAYALQPVGGCPP